MDNIASKITVTQNPRKKILLLAYACSPNKGSEAEQGWHRAIAIAKYFDTWVLCKQTSYDQINRYLDETGQIIEGLHFCPIPSTRFYNTLKRIPGCWYLFYNLWQRRAFRFAKKLHNELNFDLVHHGNIHTFREPGYLWELNIPFIWGPIGGTENYPWRFLFENGIKGALIEAVRNIANYLQLHFSYRVRRAAKKAAVLLMANSVGRKDFLRVFRINGISMLDIGAHNFKENINKDGNDKSPLKILWNGSFTYRKALQLLIKALGNIQGSFNYELNILGDGPLQERWRRLAQNLGIDECCHWLGWLPRDEVMSFYDWADILVFTSLRDTCGSVVTEALSRGVPIVCLDHNGAGDVITNECGLKIPVTNPREVILKLGDALIYLDKQRDKLIQMKHNAVIRAREYLWSRHSERLADIYDEVMIEKGSGE